MVLVSLEAGVADLAGSVVDRAGSADLDGTDVLASLEAGDGVLSDSALAGLADAISVIRVVPATAMYLHATNLLARASSRDSNSGSSSSTPDGNKKQYNQPDPPGNWRVFPLCYYFSMNDINPELVAYIEQNIFPKYDKYYSHGMIHINNVIKNMLMLADYYGLDKNMAYTVACYHDSGLNIDRENHEFESGKILASDQNLKKFFTEDQIKIMKEAVEDHRGSRKERPRNIYGECVSDSDRDFDIELLAKRQLATSLKNYPEIQTFDGHFERCHAYICKRINDGGKFNLWTDCPELKERRDKFQKDYLDKEHARSVYKKEWDRISSDGTRERIINFYEDY